MRNTDREKTWACVLCGGGSVDDSVAFCLREENVVSREGQRGLSMILQTLLWQEKLRKQSAKCETAQSSHLESFSFARRKQVPVFGNNSTDERLGFSSVFETAAVSAAG